MPPKNGGQEAGYSHLTDKTTSHPTKLANAVHNHSAKSPKDGGISRGLTPAKPLVNDNLVADYSDPCLPSLDFCLARLQIGS